MQDEEQQNEQPQSDEPQAEEPQAEEPQAEAPAEEQPPPEEALAEDAATEDDSAAEEAAAPAEEAPAEQPSSEGKAKKEDVVPGAELDPIAIEPERQLDAEERARQEAEEEERARRERELIGEGEEEAAPLAAQPAKLSGDASYSATGKRKSSVARVIIRPGDGTIQVNKRTLEEYFPREYLQSVAKQPLVQSGYEGTVDVRIRVHGGSLAEVDPELRPELKRRGMLTRDARVKERRKAGLKKARKRPQFSKR